MSTKSERLVVAEPALRKALLKVFQRIEDSMSMAAAHNWHALRALEDGEIVEAANRIDACRRAIRSITHPVCEAISNLNHRRGGRRMPLSILDPQGQLFDDDRLPPPA